MARERARERLGRSGERHVPGYGGKLTALEHEHRYAIAQRLAHGLDVLDLGCGEGYGAAMLATPARSVVGLDIDEEVIEHARSTYRTPGSLSFEAGDALSLAFRPGSFDMVVALEVIEHVEDATVLLAEARRVLRPGGLLLVSTPNPEIADDADPMMNPFHRRLFRRQELVQAVAADFQIGPILGQIVTAASYAWPLDTVESLTIDRSSGFGNLPAKYFILLATVAPATADLSLTPSSYLDADLGVVQERESFWHDSQWASAEIKRQTQELAEASSVATELRRELDRATGELTRQARTLTALRRAEVETQARLAQTLADAADEQRAAATWRSEALAAETELSLAQDTAAAAEEKLQRCLEELARNAAEHQQVRERVIVLEHALHSVFESRSWRITRPLRRIRRSTRPEPENLDTNT